LEAEQVVTQLIRIPDLAIRKLPRRFERKHFVLSSNIGLAYGILHQTCLSSAEYPSEQINSLYFDTRQLDEYHRSDDGDWYKDKIRIRWYGEEEHQNGMQTIFVELKSRQGFSGMKQRIKLEVPAEKLLRKNLSDGIVNPVFLMQTLARFGYFPEKPLFPIIKISYWRYRFCEILTEQKVSLDSQIRSTFILPGNGNGIPELTLPGGVIEIKGSGMELPESLRNLQMLGLDWTRFSKYSACIDSHLENPGAIGCLSPSGRILD
jgi:hypothetical protein